MMIIHGIVAKYSILSNKIILFFKCALNHSKSKMIERIHIKQKIDVKKTKLKFNAQIIDKCLKYIY